MAVNIILFILVLPFQIIVGVFAGAYSAIKETWNILIKGDDECIDL